MSKSFCNNYLPWRVIYKLDAKKQTYDDFIEHVKYCYGIYPELKEHVPGLKPIYDHISNEAGRTELRKVAISMLSLKQKLYYYTIYKIKISRSFNKNP